MEKFKFYDNLKNKNFVEVNKKKLIVWNKILIDSMSLKSG